MTQQNLFNDALVLDPARPRQLTPAERRAVWRNVRRSATFSPCRQYRYLLTRLWHEPLDGSPVVMFVGLNPSTADENVEDPTIRRCIGYAMDWGYGGLVMANLFGWRSTDPRALDGHPSPIEPPLASGVHDLIIRREARAAALVVAAWGSDKAIGDRGEAVCRLVGRRIECLGTNADGNPKHPLYLRRDAERIVYWEPEGA